MKLPSFITGSTLPKEKSDLLSLMRSYRINENDAPPFERSYISSAIQASLEIPKVQDMLAAHHPNVVNDSLIEHLWNKNFDQEAPSLKPSGILGIILSELKVSVHTVTHRPFFSSTTREPFISPVLAKLADVVVIDMSSRTSEEGENDFAVIPERTVEVKIKDQIMRAEYQLSAVVVRFGSHAHGLYSTYVPNSPNWQAVASLVNQHSELVIYYRK